MTTYSLVVSKKQYQILEKKLGQPLTIHSTYVNSWEAEDALAELRDKEKELHKKPFAEELMDWLSDIFQKLKQ